MLRASGGNISQAAQRMQLERRSLQRKMREYGIEVEAFRLDDRLREDDAAAAGR